VAHERCEGMGPLAALMAAEAALVRWALRTGSDPKTCSPILEQR
jgi:hypothetical protein